MVEARLGIDLGTSSAKCIALDGAGRMLGASQERYQIERPSHGWAEQDPEAWWRAVTGTIRATVAALPAGSRIVSLGVSGQMHGLVLVDHALRAVRPAIIWSDARSSDEVRQWQAKLGADAVEAMTGFPIATGMAGVSLSWVGRHEPAALERTAHALQPKDYVRLRLTGVAAVEPTDAGASLLFDLDRMVPDARLLETAGLAPEQLPGLVPTLEQAGELGAAAAREIGLRQGIPVAAGGGDQAMAALALGLDTPDRAAIALSSGGTVLVPVGPDSSAVTGYHRLAAAEPGRTLAMGVVLAAGLATDWLAAMTGTAPHALLEAAAQVRGDEHLVALPHLGGTRTPRANSSAQAAFAGLGFEHRPADLARALVEAVAIDLGASLLAIRGPASASTSVVLSGGGARFAVWRQAVANATGMPVALSTDLEHSAIGAALAGGIAAGAPVDFEARSRVGGTVDPQPESVARLAALAERRAALAAAASLPVQQEGNPHG